ncbi:MAG TPA: FtsH protease activity modulator HflK [Thiotrichaceae bacterium]|jgi:membrane protease subunit HflK|nr:FtsH protease activity modulator HflK [Thiotrichaceae bacterium]HIM08485.1 FtsH protease activity modulator HflK [Gammaproteobacteria bacterium]
MGWNEPPDGKKGKDPWGNNGGNRGNNDGPPDLGEIFDKMSKGLGGIFGSGGPSHIDNNNSAFPFAMGLILLVAWLIYDMTYVIDQQERGAVLRFGEHVETIQPGISFRFPRPIEKIVIANVGRVQRMTHRATMLTQDENIVDLEVAVKWKIKEDPSDFLFNVNMPIATLKQVTESVVREVVGKNKLDYVLTEGRSEIANLQRELISSVLEELYHIGIHIESVEMLSVKPPEQVKAAFDDAIKAREDEQRYVNEAKAYQNKIIPIARGNGARLLEESNGYKARVISRAEGEASRFEQLLTEYQRAPEVTRERLYLDAIESVYSNSSKVFIDNDNGNSLMYLPIDKLIEKRQNSSSTFSSPNFNDLSSSSLEDARQKFDSRIRGAR